MSLLQSESTKINEKHTLHDIYVELFPGGEVYAFLTVQVQLWMMPGFDSVVLLDWHKHAVVFNCQQSHFTCSKNNKILLGA